MTRSVLHRIVFLTAITAVTLLTSSFFYDLKSNKILKGDGDQWVLHIKQTGKDSFQLSTTSKKDPSFFSKWDLPYPVFHVEVGDVDGNGTDEILVGVIKATRYDPIVGKRLFIFKLVEGHIRPMWLGSRVSQPLESFHLVAGKDHPRIRTIEKEQDGKFLVANYHWEVFGLEFENYQAREISYVAAGELLYDQNAQIINP
jgi:hypothetical protein